MTGLADHLAQLRQWFVQSIAWAFKEAAAVELGAGSSPGWAQVLAQYEVAEISDEERGQVRAAQRPLRGAPVMELHAVVGAVIQRARTSLFSVDLDGASPEVESSHERLRMLLERTEGELIIAYKRAVLPRRQGMFGNVMAHHASDAASVGPTAHSLTCNHCGAPRLSDADFQCPYCGQHMAGEDPSS